jgi:hypothetical protein
VSLRPRSQHYNWFMLMRISTCPTGGNESDNDFFAARGRTRICTTTFVERILSELSDKISSNTSKWSPKFFTPPGGSPSTTGILKVPTKKTKTRNFRAVNFVKVWLSCFGRTGCGIFKVGGVVLKGWGVSDLEGGPKKIYKKCKKALKLSGELCRVVSR